MKTKLRSKIEKYVINDELFKLKKIVRKYNVNLASVLFENENSVLHLACSFGSDATFSYCIKEGLDPLLVNARGELPIHLACRYGVKNNKYAYTDIILPLVKKWPSCLDHADNRGHTPRTLLESFKSQSRELLTSESSSDSEIDRTNRHDCNEDFDWSEKLHAAFEEEAFTDQGRYFNDYQQEESNHHHDDWADDVMSQKRRKRQQAHYPRYSSSKKSKSKNNPESQNADPDSKKFKCGIDPESKKRFEENMKKLTDEEKTNQEKLKEKNIKQRRDLYEQRCQEIFSDKDIQKKLSYRAIPFPYDSGGNVKEAEEFLFRGYVKGSKEYNKQLRIQRIRWHPDRFMNRVGSKLKENDKERILDKVKEISQLLNKLSE